jgi:hypothetical protein
MSARYVKPFAMDLVNVEITSGSCLSGSGETAMGNCSATGANALNSCGGGSNVLPAETCLPGGAAGYSCVSGTTAG